MSKDTIYIPVLKFYAILDFYRVNQCNAAKTHHINQHVHGVVSLDWLTGPVSSPVSAINNVHAQSVYFLLNDLYYCRQCMVIWYSLIDSMEAAEGDDGR